MPTVQRFGSLLVDEGLLHLRQKSCYEDDERPIDETCTCSTCVSYSRAHLHHLFKNKEKIACSLATVHNLHYEVSSSTITPYTGYCVFP